MYLNFLLENVINIIFKSQSFLMYGGIFISNVKRLHQKPYTTLEPKQIIIILHQMLMEINLNVN